MSSKINIDFLKKFKLTPQPISWFLYAQGFHFSGLNLVERYESVMKANKNKLVNTLEIFNHVHMYKTALYLLSHSIELLLKAHVNSHISDKPENYCHSVMNMLRKLCDMKILSIDDDDKHIFEFVNAYLRWYGRYYCPLNKGLDECIKNDYTIPDENNMVNFKYPPKYPETHQNLDKLFKQLYPDTLKLETYVHTILFCD